MATASALNYFTNPNTPEEHLLSDEVLTQFRAAYLGKESVGLHTRWVDNEDYYLGDVNSPEFEEDPGSNTNIIHPTIESQIADLVDQPLDITVKGEDPSDHFFSNDVQHVLQWVWKKNNMTFKLDKHERHRLKFGTGIWKVSFDPFALFGRGLPRIEPVNPANFFIDPKVVDPWMMHEAEFIIHAVEKSIPSLIRQFGDRAKSVRPEGNFLYNLNLFGDASDATEISSILKNKAVLLERWTISYDDKTEETRLRMVQVAGGIVLFDSDWDNPKGYYRTQRYPFVVTPCYSREGSLWGMSDVDLLRPVQDLINDLDDQIRMNARLMGNIQIVVGVASGIDPRKWVNKPGLKIPSRDPTAWKAVEPKEIPQYIIQRRNEAKGEGQDLSGRHDVNEGKPTGSMRAASAIIALQEAGNRRINHKKTMLQAGLSQVLEIVLELVKEFYTTEMAFRIVGDQNDNYVFFKGSKLKEVPRKVPYDTGIGAWGLKDLLDEKGKAMTKEAEFDLDISIGAGMPTNKSFIYQAVVELHREGLITTEEARVFLKEMMSWPVIDPLNPVGVFAGRNLSPETMAMVNNRAGQVQQDATQPYTDAAQSLNPAFMGQMAQMMGGGSTPVT